MKRTTPFQCVSVEGSRPARIDVDVATFQVQRRIFSVLQAALAVDVAVKGHRRMNSFRGG
jgi:hypothetical protein